MKRAFFMNLETDFETMTFGQVLQYYRVDRKLTIAELARAAVMSQGAVSMLERGLRKPRWFTLRKLVAGLRLIPTEEVKLAFKGAGMMFAVKRPGPAYDPAKQDEANCAAMMCLLPRPGLMRPPGPV